MTRDTLNLSEPNDPLWEKEQRELVEILSASDAWSDLCIRRLDPCDPAFWDDDPDDD